MHAARIPDPSTHPIITVAAAADLLGIDRKSAYGAVERGELPALRIGRRVLIPTAKLLDLLGMGAVA